MRACVSLMFVLIFASACGATAPQATATPSVTPMPTMEPIPTREIVVESGYYLDRTGDSVELVEIENFDSYETTIIDAAQQGGLDNIIKVFFEDGDGIEAVYCGQECMDLYATQGDPRRIYEWQQNMKYYVLFADGSFGELALNPPQAPECIIMGVYFSEPTILNIKFQDFDGDEKMSVWQVSETEVEEVDTLPFVEESWSFAGYAFAGEVNNSFAAMVGSDGVAVFAPDNRMIDRVTPCMRG